MNTEAWCPTCRDILDCEILADSRDLLVRCEQCGTVFHTPRQEEPEPIKVKAIVSAEGESKVCEIELFPDEMCAVGDHHVAACGEDYIGVEITGIEAGPKRLKKALAKDISALWTRKIEEVTVRISVHEGWKTIPLETCVAGETEFEVGKVYTVGKRKFRVAQIKIRDGGVLRKEGYRTVASRIRRIYGYPL
jgi:uncharacterized Zn finger protein